MLYFVFICRLLCCRKTSHSINAGVLLIPITACLINKTCTVEFHLFIIIQSCLISPDTNDEVGQRSNCDHELQECLKGTMGMGLRRFQILTILSLFQTSSISGIIAGFFSNFANHFRCVHEQNILMSILRCVEFCIICIQ